VTPIGAETQTKRASIEYSVHHEVTIGQGYGGLRLTSIEQMQGILGNILVEDRVKSLSDGTKYAGHHKISQHDFFDWTNQKDRLRRFLCVG